MLASGDNDRAYRYKIVQGLVTIPLSPSPYSCSGNGLFTKFKSTDRVRRNMCRREVSGVCHLSPIHIPADSVRGFGQTRRGYSSRYTSNNPPESPLTLRQIQTTAKPLYTRTVLQITGIIPFSRLGGFYANLGSAEIFYVTKERGPQNKW